MDDARSRPKGRQGRSAKAEPEEEQGVEGRHWLKYAGIGTRRKRGEPAEGLTGEAITSLGSLEAEVLGLLWEIGRPASGMEVMERSLYKRRAKGKEPASFATIATTLRRLSDKGILTSQKNDLRTPIYTPTVNREEMAARILNNVSETLLGGPLHSFLPQMAGNIRTDRKGARKAPEDIEVQRLLDALETAADNFTAPAATEEKPSHGG